MTWLEIDVGAMGTCGGCGSPTKSHFVGVDHDVDSKPALVPAVGVLDPSVVFPVCHGCYSDVDGDVERIVQEIESYLRNEYDDLADVPLLVDDDVAVADP